MKTSQLWSLDKRDWLMGLVMAAGGGIMAVVVNVVNSWATHAPIEFSLVALWHGAVVGAIPYLLKNFATRADPTKEVTKDASGTVTKTVVSTDQVDVVVKP